MQFGESVEILRRQWLLHELDAVLDDRIDRAHRATQVPRGIRIDGHAPAIALADLAHQRDVIRSAELDLENVETALRCRRGPFGHNLGLGQPDRE